MYICMYSINGSLVDRLYKYKNKSSRSISELPTGAEGGMEDHEWRVVAATQMGEKTIMALTVINGRMTTLSVLQRLNNTISVR